MEDIRSVKGSTVVEMAYIMPLFLTLFVLIVYTVFYYHDKAILNGAACETAVLGAQAERKNGAEEYDLDQFFRERTEGKMIIMTNASVSVGKENEKISVIVTAGHSFMKLRISQKAVIAEPEEWIRWLK